MPLPLKKKKNFCTTTQAENYLRTPRSCCVYPNQKISTNFKTYPLFVAELDAWLLLLLAWCAAPGILRSTSGNSSKFEVSSMDRTLKIKIDIYSRLSRCSRSRGSSTGFIPSMPWHPLQREHKRGQHFSLISSYISRWFQTENIFASPCCNALRSRKVSQSTFNLSYPRIRAP